MFPTTLEDAYAANPGPYDDVNDDRSPLSYMEFHGSEGGHKCLWCCKYKKQSDLLVIGQSGCGHENGSGIHIAIEVQPICRDCYAKNYLDTEGENG